jgi:predicted nucleotidyltransferase
MPDSEQPAGSPGSEFYGGYQVYSDTGVDLTSLRENLKRTIEERLEHNARALRLVRALRETAQQVDSGSENRPRDSMLDPAPLLRQLHISQVDFVVIGGLAMIAQGSDYMTKDLDICYSRSERNLAAIATAFAPLHPYRRGAPPGLPFQVDAPTLKAGLNFTLVTDLGDVDLLGEVRGVGWYDQVLAQSEARTIAGLTIRVLSLDGLIAAKKAAGRAKDKLQLEELERLKKLRESRP